MANVLCFCYCIVSIVREKCSHISVIQSNLVKRLMEAVGGGGGCQGWVIMGILSREMTS